MLAYVLSVVHASWAKRRKKRIWRGRLRDFVAIFWVGDLWLFEEISGSDVGM
jgi:hypothetical protein